LPWNWAPLNTSVLLCIALFAVFLALGVAVWWVVFA
jgi:hypothetical protein